MEVISTSLAVAVELELVLVLEIVLEPAAAVLLELVLVRRLLARITQNDIEKISMHTLRLMCSIAVRQVRTYNPFETIITFTN